MDKAPDAFRTISEVAAEIDVPQHVLRFWESRFAQIKPMKRGGGRRYYRPDDVDLLRGIRHLLYGEGYTIRGVQRILRDEGTAFVQNVWRAGAVAPPPQSEDDLPEEDFARGTRTKAGRNRIFPRLACLRHRPSSVRLNRIPCERREPTLTVPASGGRLSTAAETKLRACARRTRRLSLPDRCCDVGC